MTISPPAAPCSTSCGAKKRASLQAYRQSVQMEKNGLAIPLDVLTAQDTLLNSELQSTSEAFSRTIFYLDLIRAVGDLNPATPSTLRWSLAPD